MVTERPSKNGSKTSGGGFKPGNPGGPGRPAGSRNRQTLILDQIAAEDGGAVLQTVLSSAKGGDMAAARIILDRVWPARKSRPVCLSLPEIKTAADVVSALGAVADAVGVGDISPDEGAAVASILETKRRAIETTELETRITALEKRK